MKKILLALAVSFAGLLSAQVSSELAVPRLVVGITIDQMRADMIARYWSGFGRDGFQRLVRNGTWMIDTRYHYVPTYTGPGHASIYSGTGPAGHGIVANTWYDRNSDQFIYCVDDSTTKLIGGLNGERGASPHNLMSTTIADELELFTAGRSKTIGVSLKDRGAVLPVGRTGDAAYWYDNVTGNFVSSTWYAGGLPTWVREFNKENRTDLYLSKPWNLLYPRERYEIHLRDDNKYEHALGGADSPSFPYDLPGLYAQTKDKSMIGLTPLGNTIVTDMAINTILYEEMGLDETTDLLAISYSSTDKLGHATGPRSIELEDMYYRLDLEIARLLHELDKLVGEDRYLVFVTSDHGVVDVPQYLADRKGSAGYVDKDGVTKVVEDALSSAYGAGPWIKAHINQQMYLDLEKAEAQGVTAGDLRLAAQQALYSIEQVNEVVTADQLLSLEFTRGQRARIQNGYKRMRAGDVHYSLHPGFLLAGPDDQGKGTTHGSGYTYDTQVPLLFFGFGTPQKQVARTVTVRDIAPTIAMWCGFALPDACQGSVISEMFVDE